MRQDNLWARGRKWDPESPWAIRRCRTLKPSEVEFVKSKVREGRAAWCQGRDRDQRNPFPCGESSAPPWAAGTKELFPQWLEQG